MLLIGMFDYKSCIPRNTIMMMPERLITYLEFQSDTVTFKIQAPQYIMPSSTSIHKDQYIKRIQNCFYKKIYICVSNILRVCRWIHTLIEIIVN